MHNRPQPAPPLPRLEAHLGYCLRQVSNHVSGAFARALYARHVSVAEWVALCCVHDVKDMTPGKLANALGLTRGAISKVLDKLEAKNWTARATKLEDSRIQFISLTPRGRRVLPKLTELADRNEEKFFGCLGPDEQAALRRLLQKLTEFHQFQDIPID
ncbi:MAG: MarR family winged helix-turn-helix transcriptional regulator [Terriglobia bacterium]